MENGSFMDVVPIKMVIFNSKLLVYQRVSQMYTIHIPITSHMIFAYDIRILPSA
jgi:hypothetical protein